MKALVLRNVGSDAATVSLEERPVPELAAGEVLLKVHGSPINPSDRLYARGLYGIRPTEGQVGGFEGAGTVVASRAGLYGRWLSGKRVAAAVQGEDGFWAEYVKVPASRCLPLGPSVPDDAAATAIVNPLTAWALFEPVLRGKEKGLVQTAAASQVGRMILRLGKKHGKPVVSVVHRPGLVDTLQKEGFGDVFDSSAPDFEKRLRERCKALGLRYAVDAVGGAVTAVVGRALDKRGTVHVYGALEEANAEADPLTLIFRHGTVKGFWLNEWMGRQGALGMLSMQRRLEKLLATELRTEFAHRLPLAEVAARYVALATDASRGKVLVLPS